MNRFWAIISLAIVLIMVGGCSSPRDEVFTDRKLVTVVPLGAVEEEMLPSSPVPVLKSYVWVKVLSPTELSSQKQKLVLATFYSFAPGRPVSGSIWKMVGAPVEAEVVVQTQSGDLYLDPPVAREKRH